MTDLIFRQDIVARLKDSMPKVDCDESIIEAMLVSSDKDNNLIEELMNIPKTEGRIRFLMKGRHGTPFEHNAMKFYVEAPIFVFREWHRHRIGQSYNEQSGRYSELPPMFYTPPEERPLVQVGKPGAYTYVPGNLGQYNLMQTSLRHANQVAYEQYEHMMAHGIAKEVARMCLPVNIYSKMYVTLNARSLMAFLSLRTKSDPYWIPNGQGEFGNDLYETNPGGAMFPSGPMWEIEQAARLTEKVFADLFPLTYAAYNDLGRVAP